MTMHQSKGLEFPVTFVSDCGHGFNLTDATATVLFDRTYGLSVKLRDESGYARLKNPIYNVLSDISCERAIEEELRVLYVALTRPKERLYVTATVSDVEALFKKVKSLDHPLDASTTYACRSYADLLITAAGNATTYDLIVNGYRFQKDAPTDLLMDGAAKEAATAAPDTAAENASAASVTTDAAATRACRQELARRFAYVYPDRHLSSIPGKLSVSRLYPTALDGTEEESLPLALAAPAGEALASLTVLQDDGTRVFRNAPIEDENGEDEEAAPEPDSENPARPTVPRFLGGERDTAARAGTATHLFMQFCDFASLKEKGVKAELARLVSLSFLSGEDAALVRLDEVEAFAKSPLFAALSQEGSRVYRELRFHARFPAAAFTADPEKKRAYKGESVLVQGVMDAVLLTESGELWLIDYKTDRLSFAEKRNRAAGEQKLRARHALQLSYYTAACREIFGRIPDRVLIYSLALGDTVALSPVLPDGI